MKTFAKSLYVLWFYKNGIRNQSADVFFIFLEVMFFSGKLGEIWAKMTLMCFDLKKCAQNETKCSLFWMSFRASLDKIPSHPQNLSSASMLRSGVGQVAHASPTPRVTQQNIDITRRTLEAVCWLWMGCWSNNVANSHLSPRPCHSSVLRSFLAPQCSYPPHWPCHQRRLRIMTGCLRHTPAGNLPILTSIQPDDLRRKRATLSLARRAMEPGDLIHSALTCSPSGNARRRGTRGNATEWECTPSQIEITTCPRCKTTHQFIWHNEKSTALWANHWWNAEWLGTWASAENFPRGGKVDVLLICFWLLTMQRKLTYTKKKMSNVTATVAFSAFFVSKLYTEQMFVLVSMDILRLS